MSFFMGYPYPACPAGTSPSQVSGRAVPRTRGAASQTPGPAIPPHQKNRTFDDGPGGLGPCGCENPPERRPRNTHTHRGVFLVEPFHVGEPERLQLVETKDHHRKIPRWLAQRPESLRSEAATDATIYGGTSHDNNEHMLTTNVCQGVDGVCHRPIAGDREARSAARLRAPQPEDLGWNDERRVDRFCFTFHPLGSQ